MQEQINALRKNLREKGCDSLISFNPPANEYLSGFSGSTSALIVSAGEAVFLCDFRYTEQAQANVRGFEVHEVSGPIETRAAEWLAKLSLANTAFDPTVLTVHQLDTIKKSHTGEYTPFAGAVTSLREVKSPAEIEKLRAATQLAEAAFLSVKPKLKEGITEREFAAHLEYAFKSMGAAANSFEPIVLFGARSSLPHGRPSGKNLEKGDIILLDFGCVLDSYCSDLTRTFAFATISHSWFEEIYAVCLAAQKKALAGIRAGVVAKDVDALARDTIKDAGYGDFFGHGLGHGVGLEVHESPRLNHLSDTVLAPGMVVTVEPGIYLPGKGGVRIEDLVVVTENGCDILTQLPKELEVLQG